MIQRKRLITAGGTLLCALGIGYFMQAGGQKAPAPRAPAQAQQMATAPQAELPTVTNTSSVVESVEVAEIKPASAAAILPEAPSIPALNVAPLENAALGDSPIADTLDLPSEEAVPSLACEHTLDAQTEAAAMVRLKLNAPCMLNERFTLHHNGMMFTEVTDTDGKAEFVVPALSENSVFIVAFANGEGAVASISVSSLEYYDRAVLQWKGYSGMQVHALEYGADYGETGHVWAEAARDQSSAALGEGGFLTRLGAADVDNALLAEVYTFPSGVAKRGGEVVLSVETEITQANCGRDIEAQSIQKTADGALKTQDLELAMPDCNTVGDFLVLKNLLNDLKIAGN